MEEFYDAAIRNWYDAVLLIENREYDNAVCMLGFAAECSLKKIMHKIYPMEEIRKYSHDGERLLEDLCVILLNDNELLATLDPALGFRLRDIIISNILFEDHPQRRYYKDGTYSKNDSDICKKDAEKIIREMLRLYIDGYVY